MSKKQLLPKEVLERLKTQGMFHRFRCGFCEHHHLAKFNFREAVIHGGHVLVRVDKIGRGCRSQWFYVPVAPMDYAIFVSVLGLEHMIDRLV